MTKKQMAQLTVLVAIINALIGAGFFVTYPSMTAYAVSKDTMQLVLDGIAGTNKRLDTMNERLDRLANR